MNDGNKTFISVVFVNLTFVSRRSAKQVQVVTLCALLSLSLNFLDSAVDWATNNCSCVEVVIKVVFRLMIVLVKNNGSGRRIELVVTWFALAEGCARKACLSAPTMFFGASALGAFAVASVVVDYQIASAILTRCNRLIRIFESFLLGLMLSSCNNIFI